MLTIDNVHACVTGGEAILKGVHLQIKPGTVNVIMGPNGSGKSTLSNVLAGSPDYEITDGSITYKGKNLAGIKPHERVAMGLFMAFQYPVSLPGVSTLSFLQASINQVAKIQGKPLLDAYDLIQKAEQAAEKVGLDKRFLQRSFNEGFSGGEKKRNEVLQMMLMQPDFAILDETDSGLDIDALKTVSASIESMRCATRSFLIITHYNRILKYVKPDFVHVMSQGKIIKSGGYELANRLEKEGYSGLMEG